MKRYIVILTFWMSGHLLPGQGFMEDYNTKYTITKKLLSTDDGLASHEVYCSLQDESGFMWFGTRNGLNRYDGQSMVHFTSQRDTLQGNKVVQLARDGAGHIFIEYGSPGFQLTTNGKVDVMNSMTREIKTLTDAFPDLPFKERDVYWISNNGSEEIYFLTAVPFRLWKYSFQNGFSLEYEMKDWNKADAFPFNEYRHTGRKSIFTLESKLLKIFKLSTQYLLSQDGVTSFQHHDIESALPLGFTSENDLLFAYATDANTNSFQVGLVTPQGETDLFEVAPKWNTKNIVGQNWDQIICANDGMSSILYSDSGALYLWNEHAFKKVVSTSEVEGFENLFLYQLYRDDYGHLWLCTSNGVLQLNINKNRFNHYFSSKQQSFESNPQVRGIYAEPGILIANEWTHTFFKKDKIMKNYENEEINYGLVIHDSALYSGGFSLYRVDLVNNTLIKLPGTKESEIWSMLSVNDSLLLLGKTNGLSMYNSRQKKMTNVFKSSERTIEAKFVYRIFKDSKGTIWGVAENGLYKLNLVNNEWSITKEQSQLVSVLTLQDACIDKNGIFWLATSGEGLYRWNRKTHSIRQFTINDGFPTNVLYRIEPDEHNNLWISTDFGLVRFNKLTFSVKTYTTADGITHNEFNRASSFAAPDGRLYFGGLDGVNAFYPEDFLVDTTSYHLPLQILEYNQYSGNQKGLINKTIDLLQSNQITLAPDDLFFILEFQLLDFSNDKVHRYAYKIDGLDQQWNYINENYIRISGLPFGDFSLRVKAQNGEGAWSKSELSIPLIVLKPFYLKWWFILFLALLLVITVYWVIRWRTHQLAIDKINLEQIVNERTMQLKQSIVEQDEMLMEKDLLMKEIHHRVKNNLQVISGLLELQGKSLTDKAAIQALNEGRNRVRSIALIHQNLYQVENINAIELDRFVKDLCRQVNKIFNQQKEVIINIDVLNVNLDIDTAAPLGLIMNELLTNSFKYAFDQVETGEIHLKIRKFTDMKYELKFSDNGPGLPDYIELTQATTLGLQLINDLSRQVGGHVEYHYKNGPVFTIYFTTRKTRKNKD